MSVQISRFLQAGYPLNTDGDTAIWSSTQSATTGAPSGLPTASGGGYLQTSGVEWLDLWLTAATDAVEVTIYAYSAEAGVWCIDTAFAVSGVLSVPVGSWRYSHQALGADWVYVRITSVGSGGTITGQATLTQGCAK